ncbi:DNA methyltransferase [Cytobacillus oceanisediminis]|uniref:DNA methylase n=1 Tax=Cytobacillus oceanisediminis 2691 TaxID=1196031 RepID=A0A160MGV5_9BACI|nr:DNA methyltransferase [Cytobacillus oceanisediminis]AND42632.1 DNA methylase [Cytobacillus oceanisediminis 2691]
MTNNEQLSFEVTKADNTPVVCLGMTFESEEARREYFREELRKKLPELKQIEGFPIGEDEDIITLSDPPYYTACPNPWVNNFIEEWEKEKFTKYGRDVNDEYHREPFTTDVSEGKNESIYTAHTYHTKVPYKAIMRYILHYTKPGDIILDAFSGTGMTGVAANMCGDKEQVMSLNMKTAEVGSRKSILSDLSPAASFITANYNTEINSNNFVREMEKLIVQSESEFGNYYTTKHSNGENGQINYVIWSDVFECPECNEEIIFYNEAYDSKENVLLKNFPCPKCSIELSKEKMNRVFETVYDNVLNENINIGKQEPVQINYIYNKKQYKKVLDDLDKELIKRINDSVINTWVPTDEMPIGVNTQQPLNSHGFKNVHHFYTKRNLAILGDLFSRINHDFKGSLYMKLAIQSILYNLVSKLVRYNLGNRGNGILNGTLYVSSLTAEANIYKVLNGKVRDLQKALIVKGKTNINSIQSANSIQLKDNSIDYIFTDPPFGANINYSELNYIWESWLKVKTSIQKEAIVNAAQEKSIEEYKTLIEECFSNYYRVLKPNRWITVEFSNSKASVWNAIQEAMQKAGFVIANVAALDKKQGSFKAVTSTTAVKQDLVISAYKPGEENIIKMREQTNTPESAWTFISQHLEKLPVFLGAKGEASIIAERTPRILFDRMVAYHVQSGFPVPISSAEFQVGVTQRFPMRDGMAFLESQVAEYDKKRTLVKEFTQMSLFVSDENSSIEWIRQQLMKKPQTRQDLHPQFMKEIQHIAKHEQLPELDDLLAQNFLRYEGEETVPDQIASYLRRNFHDMRGLENTDGKLRAKAMNRWYVPDPNKQADLEKLREKTLLREFDHYVEELGNSKKKLKQFRTEAIRAGFKKAWSEKNYEKIVTVGDRLPEQVIQEDDKLLMYYDNAQVRLDM